MSQGKGTISSNDLMQKLVNAKKVMNKVATYVEQDVVHCKNSHHAIHLLYVDS